MESNKYRYEYQMRQAASIMQFNTIVNTYAKEGWMLQDHHPFYIKEGNIAFAIVMYRRIKAGESKPLCLKCGRYYATHKCPEFKPNKAKPTKPSKTR